MAADETVTIVVEARDEATKVLGNVASGMSDLAKPAKGLTGILGGVGGALGTAIGTFTGGAALDLAAKGFSALTGFVGDGVAGAKEAAAGYAQLGAVLASTGGAVGLTADELANLSGDLSQAKGVSTFADDQILSLENLLLTFTNVKGDIFKEATSIGVDMATALGTEPSAAAVQLGKALNDPIAGVGALSRVGVTFTEQQKEQIKVMQESGDMAGAQSVILAELTKEFGGSAQAAADAAGPQAQFAEQLGELSEEIGAALLPLMNEFFGLLTSPAVMGAIEGIVTFLTHGITLFIDMIKAMKAGFDEGGIAGMLDPLLRLFEHIWPLILETAIAWGKQLLGWLVTYVPVIVKQLGEWTLAFFEWLPKALPPLLANLRHLLGEIISWIVANGPGIVRTLLTWAQAFAGWVLTEALPALLKALGSLLGSLLGWIASEGPKLATAALAWGKSLIDGMLAGIKSNWDKVAAWILGQLRHIPGFDLFFGSGGGTPGGQAATFGAGSVPAGNGVSGMAFGAAPSGVTRGGSGMAAAVLTINVDARGAESPLAVEEAGYRGVMRALNEAKQRGGGRQSADNLRRALDSLARAG